jgi:hypothetical protein
VSGSPLQPGAQPGAQPRRHIVVDLASDEARSCDELIPLAAHPSWRVRRVVASHPNASPALVSSLVHDLSARVRVRVAARDFLTADALSELSCDPFFEVRRRIAKHDTLGPDDQIRLASDPIDAVRATLAQTDKLDQRAIAILAEDDHLWVVTSIATRSDLEPATAHRLLGHPHRHIQHLVISHAPLPLDAQQSLAQSPDPTIPIALARNPLLHARVRFELVRSPRWQIRAAALANARCDLDDVLFGLQAAEAGVQQAAAMHPALHAVDSDWLRRRLPLLAPSARLALAANPATPSIVVDHLIYDGFTDLDGRLMLRVEPIRWIAGRALGNPAAPAERLRMIADRAALPPWAQGHLARNPTLDAELRDSLLTWLALGGGADGDPTYDPATNIGHPGDPRSETATEALQLLSIAEGSLDHPIDGVRATWTTTQKTFKFPELFKMATDPSVGVRRRATAFQPLPANLIEIMRHDSDEAVRSKSYNVKVQEVPVIPSTGSPAQTKTRGKRIRNRRSPHKRGTSGLRPILVFVVFVLLARMQSPNTTPTFDPTVDHAYTIPPYLPGSDETLPAPPLSQDLIGKTFPAITIDGLNPRDLATHDMLVDPSWTPGRVDTNADVTVYWFNDVSGAEQAVIVPRAAWEWDRAEIDITTKRDATSQPLPTDAIVQASRSGGLLVRLSGDATYVMFRTPAFTARLR